MPIIEFTLNETDIPSNAVNLRSEPIIICGSERTLWTWDAYVGLCISNREVNGYDDSDWYMKVWNEEKNCPEEIFFATTRGWSYPSMRSYPDATPEVMAKYEHWLELERLKALKRAEEREDKEVRKGKMIRVVRGRKVPRGTVGQCIYRGRGYYDERVGLKTESGEVFWTSLKNVEVVLDNN
jgi:hypothetical protein